MRYLCVPCTKKSIVNAYSYVTVGIALIVFVILMFVMGADPILLIVTLLAGLIFLFMGIGTAKMLKNGLSISEEEFHEVTVGNADFKGNSYITYPFNKKE